MSTITRLTRFPVLLTLTACLAAAAPVSAQSGYEVVHTFSGNKGRPSGAPAQGSDGKLYGTTVAGGSLGKGSIYATDAAGATATIHEFSGADGVAPRGSLMRATDGAIYGTTSQSTPGAGTVFRITREGKFETLAQFNGPNGASPEGGLVEAGGNLYGTTRSGGANGNGTIFRMTPAGELTTLLSFADANGAFPTGSLIKAGDGKLYGTTRRGGEAGLGTLFRVGLDGVLETLVSFDGVNGAVPSDAPIQATDGNFYGTTTAGGTAGLCDRGEGSDDGCGTIYRLTPSGLELVHFFSDADGALPMGALRQVGGHIYGTTQEGGWANGGTIFRLGLDPLALDGAFTSIAEFSGDNGALPASGVIQVANGAIYGTTEAGGPLNYGTLFELLPGNAIRTAISFTGAKGADPSGRLTQGGDGDFYGTTLIGGEHGFGTVFRMTAAGDVTTIVSFDGNNGASPSGGLILARDAALYGTTETGGENSAGTIFRVNVDGTWETLASFDFEVTGASPSGGLIEGRDGRLYGTTPFVAAGSGAVFRFDRNDRSLTAVGIFADEVTQGGFPSAGVIEAPNGDFYGTAEAGGANGLGAVFRWSPMTGELATAFSFSDGAVPASPLFLGSDTKLYGTTTFGGDSDSGTLFRMAFDGTLETLASFDGANGALPYLQGVIEVSEGVFVGTTSFGGAYDLGAVYQWSADTGITALHEFDGVAVDGPNTTLIKASDGALYGTAFGPLGGVIYRVILESDDTPPVLQVPGNLVVNATAPNGAKVDYIVSATDESGEPVTISCSPASGSIFPIGTTTVTCTATDASGNVSQGSFKVKVLGAPEQIVALIEKLRGMPLSPTVKTYVISLLQKALADPRKTALVCDVLKAVITYARLKCPAQLAAQIIADATRIRAVIGCV